MTKKEMIKVLVLSVMLFLSSFGATVTYSKYVSGLSDTDEVRVAKAGELVLVEKLNGIVQANNSSSTNEITHEIVSGGVVDKEVYVELYEPEVSTYIFLVVNNVNWTYDNELRKLSVINNKSDLLYFTIDDNWNFLEEVSDESKFVFYHLVDVNDSSNTGKYNVLDKINVGIINVKDIDSIDNSRLNFSAYSIQKANDDTTVIEAWNNLDK